MGDNKTVIVDSTDHSIQIYRLWTACVCVGGVLIVINGAASMGDVVVRAHS